MSELEKLDDLLDQWEEARERGRAVSVEQLCHDCPELLTPLHRKIAALEAFDRCVNRDGQDNQDRGSSFAADSGSSRSPAQADAGQPPNLTYDSQLMDLVVHARGGLGVVYRGTDEKLNRTVAIKFIQSRHAHNEELTQRFMQEAEITGRLDHPGVVPVYAIGETNTGQPFYSMRFIRGESLDEQLKNYHAELPRLTRSQRRLRMRQMLTSMVSVCRTIAYAHTRGIVHRDIKPQNVMLGKYGEALIVDWGLALPIGRESHFRVTDETTLRVMSENELRPDMGEGTPAYMSPEQAVGNRGISPASDIYSLGVTLYKVITGQLAYEARTASEVRHKIIQGDFSPPHTHDRSLDRPLESICLKAMALEPSDRYATATDFADDLENWLADNQVTAHRYSRGERAWRWCRRNLGLISGLAVGLSLLSIALMFVSGYVVKAGRQKEQLHRQAVRSLQHAIRNQEENVQMTCRVVAKSIRLTMEASVAAIEELAASSELIEILEQPSPGDDAERAERARQLETLLANARCRDDENLHAVSWLVLDADGQLLSRSSDSISQIQLNQPMWTRLYFHGGDRVLPTDLPASERPTAIKRTVITPLFIGKGKGWQLCSIASPVKDANQNVIGVVGMTMQVGCFDPAEQLEATESTQFVSLVETRGKWSGRLIHHPALKKEAGDSDTESSLEIGSRAAVTNASVDGEVLDQLSAVDRQSLKPTVLDDYHDPLLGDTDTHWIAVTAPLRVHSRRYGWLDNGWYLIVQDRRYEMPSSLKATESFRLY